MGQKEKIIQTLSSDDPSKEPETEKQKTSGTNKTTPPVALNGSQK